MKNNKVNKGFTLVELIIAIAILAILAGGIAFLVINVRGSADDALAYQTAGRVAEALNSFNAMRHAEGLTPIDEMEPLPAGFAVNHIAGYLSFPDAAMVDTDVSFPRGVTWARIYAHLDYDEDVGATGRWRAQRPND